jgi:hypothetical protein
VRRNLDPAARHQITLVPVDLQPQTDRRAQTPARVCHHRLIEVICRTSKIVDARISACAKVRTSYRPALRIRRAVLPAAAIGNSSHKPVKLPPRACHRAPNMEFCQRFGMELANLWLVVGGADGANI